MNEEETPIPAATPTAAPESETPGAEQTPATGDEKPGTPPEGKEVKPAAKQSWHQRKIAELSFQNREMSRRLDKAMEIVEQSVKPKGQAEGPPKLEDYGSLDEYLDARDAYTVKKSNGERTAETQTRAQSDPEFEIAREELVNEGIEAHEDFQDKLDSAKYITPAMAYAILEADNRVEVSYFLFENQKEARRIAQLSPARQAAEIGKLEAKLAKEEPKPKKLSSAPAPVIPVSGSATNDTDIKPEMGFKEFLKVRNKQLGRK